MDGPTSERMRTPDVKPMSTIKASGSGRVTLMDVAARAGVSRATASLVVREKGNLAQQTRERVRAAMDDLGYVYHRGAASLRTRRTQSVGIIVPDVSLDFIAELTTAFETTMTRGGIVTLIGTSAEDLDHQQLLVRSMLERQVDGIVVVPAAGSKRSLGEMLADSKVPTVITARQIRFRDLPYVGADNLQAGRIVGEHLLFHQRRRIVYLGGREGLRPRHDRVRGLTTVLERSGTGARLVADVAGIAKGAQGRDATRALIAEQGLPDAIVCHNDLVAFGAYRALREESPRAAARVSVVSNDDIAAAALWEPPLTTVAVRGGELGHRCAEVLLRRIEDPHGPMERSLISPTLVVRESCGCPAPPDRG